MLAVPLRLIPQLGRRLYSTPAERHALNINELNEWISRPKQLILTDAFRFEPLSDLYITLPTRDGTRNRYQPPEVSHPLGYGHHLAFFHPRNPESRLRSDGTDADFCPPEPFSRRMWAGGKMTWDNANPLLVGENATATSTVLAVEKKGFEKGSPMVFVKQKVDVVRAGQRAPSVVEERTHVYLSKTINVKRTARPVDDVPTSVDFSFRYTPSLTTLFRFSALTFNGHHIHLDKDYAQQKEGYPERLVHGPLTALMLLETVVLHNPNAQLKSFEYRARNPMIVGRRLTIYGAWRDKHNAHLWCVDEDGIVGMTGSIEVT